MDTLIIIFTLVIGVSSIIGVYYQVTRDEYNISSQSLIASAKTNSAVSKVDCNLDVLRKTLIMRVHINTAQLVMNTLTNGQTFEKLKDLLNMHVECSPNLKIQIEYIEE